MIGSGWRQFYGSAFGWQTQLLGEDMGHYVLATTTDTDEKAPKHPARLTAVFSRNSPIGRRNTPPSSLR